MVTYNRLRFTQKSLNSIIKRTNFPYRLIVIDNHSTDGTVEYLRDKKEIDVLHLNLENEGLEKALQFCLKESVESSYFVTTDNDCIAPLLTPCWLEQLYTLIKKYPKYAAIALRPQILVGVGKIFNTDKEVVENNVVGGSFRIFNTKAVKQVGGWSNQFVNNGRGNEEWNICTKLRKAGYKVGYTKNLWTYHIFGEKNWGYPQSINAASSRSIKTPPKDIEYNPITCEPKIKHNE